MGFNSVFKGLKVNMMRSNACFFILGRATEWNVSFVGSPRIEPDRSLLASGKEMMSVVLL
jgi:hypothetical protein